MFKQTSLGIINFDKVVRIEPTANGEANLVYSNGETKLLSAEQHKELKAILCKTKADELNELLPLMQDFLTNYFEMLGIPLPIQPQGKQEAKDPDRPEPKAEVLVKEEKKEDKPEEKKETTKKGTKKDDKKTTE